MRDCINCKNSVVTGKFRKATLLDPPEYPEFDYCNYDGEVQIGNYLRLFDYNLKLKRPLLEEQYRAEYCPCYSERGI